MRNRNASTVNYLKKKKEEFFRISKKFFSWQIYNVISQIQFLYISVAFLASVDIVIGLIMGLDIWLSYFLTILQIVISLFITGALKRWPLNYGTINSIGCIIIHSVWAIQQTLIGNQESDLNKNSQSMAYFKGERHTSFGYMLGVLCFLMISNTSNLTVKCFLITFNAVFYCAMSNAPLYILHYIIIIILGAWYALYCDERGREQLIREAEWMFELKNVLPNSILVVEYDRSKGEIDLHMSNEKARHLFNLNGTAANFIDFCQHVTLKKKIKEEVNETLFYLEQSTQKNGNAGINNSIHVSKHPESQHINDKDSDFYKKNNLHNFLLQKFQQLDEEMMQKDMQRQTSLQSQDKKSTKTNLAAAFLNNNNNNNNNNNINHNNNGGNITEFTNKQQASKSFFGQSKTIINMMTSQKSQRKMMMPHHPANKYKEFTKKFEEYRCVYHRHAQLMHQQQSPQMRNNRQVEEDNSDIKFTIKLCVYTCIDDYFVVMSLDESNISEKYQIQSRQCFFYEEFCKQSLLKSTDQVVSLVQEIKTVMNRSSIITELDLSRFINSNIYTADSALSNNLKPSNSNPNIAGNGSNIIAPAGAGNGSHLTNPTSMSNKGMYCIPKRQLDHTLQLGLYASTVISNYVNYFALRYKKRAQIEEKPLSIIKIIRSIQRIFQREIDSKNISVLINSSESYVNNPNSNVNITSNIINQASSAVQLPTINNINAFSNNTFNNNISSNHNINNNNNNNNNNNINNTNNSMNNITNNLNHSILNPNISFTNVSALSVINHLTSSKDNPFQINTNNNNNNMMTTPNSNNNNQNNQNMMSNQIQNSHVNNQIVYPFLQTRSCDEISNDEAKLQHLIFNLFQNAVENTPQHGTIAFLIQRDQLLENCIKIRIRNKCYSNYNFPFLELEDSEISIGWKSMLDQFDQSGKFYFGIRMAAKLSSLIGPYNSLQFKDIHNQELQAEFLITDFAYEKSANGIYNQQSSSFKSYDGSSSFVGSEKQSSEFKQKPSNRAARIRCNSVSSYRVRMDSMDSFDKWIKIQNLETQKGQNTLRIRNQLKYKN